MTLQRSTLFEHGKTALRNTWAKYLFIHAATLRGLSQEYLYVQQGASRFSQNISCPFLQVPKTLETFFSYSCTRVIIMATGWISLCHNSVVPPTKAKVDKSHRYDAVPCQCFAFCWCLFIPDYYSYQVAAQHRMCLQYPKLFDHCGQFYSKGSDQIVHTSHIMLYIFECMELLWNIWWDM